MSDQVEKLVEEMLTIYHVPFTNQTSREVAVETWARQFTEAAARAGAAPQDGLAVHLCPECEHAKWTDRQCLECINRAGVRARPVPPLDTRILDLENHLVYELRACEGKQSAESARQRLDAFYALKVEALRRTSSTAKPV